MPMYMRTYIYEIHIYSYFSVSSSVIDVQTIVTSEDANNWTYLFTVTCIIRADSLADECIVTATPDDQLILLLSRTGNALNHIRKCIYVYHTL